MRLSSGSTCALFTAALLLGAAPVARADEPSSGTSDSSIRVEPPNVATMLGRFTTSYAVDAEHKGRAFNVQLAAEAVDGKVIAAGATFSFNDAVGERTAALGFVKGAVIRDLMIAEGMGGGTCQVASTLYAAALLSGLDIVARAPHTRPSAYIRMGLDATVAFGKIDLKVRNPSPDPVVVRARAAKGTLDVWFDTSGSIRPAVTLTSEILERTPFTRMIERDKTLADDLAHTKVFGIPGYRVRRTRELRAADGTIRRDVRIDVYPPTNQIVRVSPSFDESRLRRQSDESDDPAPSSPTPTVPLTVDAGAVRPALVQLRPSSLVVLDNGTQ